MKLENIKPGMTLEMKPEVFIGCVHADGTRFASPYVIVRELRPHRNPKRKKVYIVNAAGDCFDSSDFTSALDFQPIGAE